MKSKFYKHGIAALVGVSALALAGCQRNEKQSGTSNAKSKSSIVKIEKKSKSKSSKSEKQEGEVKNRAVRILIRQVVRRKMEKKYRQLLN